MKEKLQMLSTFIWVLSLSVLLTIYLAWLFYPIEVDLLKITKVVFMTKKSILYNFNGLMDYLTNPLVKSLKFASFTASKAGLAHFADVKGLFHLAQALFILCSLPALPFLSKNIKAKTLGLYRRYLGLAIILPLAVAIMALLIGFDNFFVLFHHILFAGKDNWSFDPLTDPIIWILPETFFMHCFILFFVLYEAIFIGLFGISRRRK
ncbi:hypothetical protein AT575_04370 [Streptococcus penaeicida]|uniref:TIGR01906 family membrane protein n=1 Tax=Streptococcus penaeicida TaxID=1765960 RepID=A0A2N8LCF0_9STRE|nr:TIGR01906 family membrane protein [Streptococcus penaeicida]PND47848.1 hypothetical protein AT575_04370 [Streptococcus penaeicida]